MLCQNCGKNEVNFRYTQIINGVKKEMSLCDKCAKELGLKDMDFSMPINFSSFFSDFFHDTESFLPSFTKSNLLECSDCNMAFEEFANTGEFGCGNCYITFADKIAPVLKNLHGSITHVGRGYTDAIDELEENKNRFEKSQKQKENKVKKENNIENSREEEIKLQITKMQKELQKAVKEERYEDAAKIRDEIKKIENNI